MRSLFVVILILLCSCANLSNRTNPRSPSSDNALSCSSATDHFRPLPENFSSRLEAFNEDEQSALVSHLSLFTKSKEQALFLDYIDYLTTRKPANITKDIERTPLLKGEDWHSQKSFKKFSKRIKKFQKIEKEIEQKIKKEKGLNPNEVQTRVSSELEKYKKLYTGCHTKAMTQEHKAGGKTFTYFMMSTSAISSGAFYAWSNRNDEEFGSESFFKKMGYEMSADAIWAFLASKIFGDPEGNFLIQSLKLYASDNLLVLVDALVWEKAFGEGENEALKRLEELYENPNFKQDLEKLVAYLERDKFMDKFKDRFEKALIALNLSKEDPNIDWSKLTKDDLGDEEVKELLMKAALIEMYEEDERELSLGTYGADRYAFYSAVGIPSMFIDGAVTGTIYKIMCMAPYNKTKAFTMGALVFTVYSVIFDYIVYPARKKAIGE